ncbi:MAG: hypothetical protein DDT20_01876 [Firmicutes bacterium]|nr:hypothetical protein [Bacillota bacterium]
MGQAHQCGRGHIVVFPDVVFPDEVGLQMIAVEGCVFDPPTGVAAAQEQLAAGS